MTLSLPLPERDHDEGAPAGTAALRAALAEQLAPVVAFDRWFARRCEARLAGEPWRARALTGALPYAPTEALAAAGDLGLPYQHAVEALERAGLASNRAAARARQLAHALHPLIVSWIAGETVAGAHARAVARRAAAMVARVVLRRTSEVMRDLVPAAASVASCPCCGGAPDLAFVERDRRTLVCSRCDSRWLHQGSGCLGCGATASPAFSHIRAPHAVCAVAVCGPCGRYLKELDAPLPSSPAALHLERALLEPVDEAASNRGVSGTSVVTE